MTKTIILGIAIAAAFVSVMLLTTEQAYAPPGTPAERVTFSFNQASAGSLTMQGGGMWIVGDASSVKAAGGFNDSTTAGNWQATTLTNVAGTCGGCNLISTSSPSSAAFKADFRDADGTVTSRDVIVATGDLCSCLGLQTIWVQGFGFGTANTQFN